ncbi:MAG: ribonuclease Z [Candidatus Micrarchaeota archaeon]|nr:ribonuclease Z [Candidatus Micrarchaeota archaeon]
MFSITFLGTAGSMPTPERNVPAVAIKYEGKIFLFDCGEGTQRQMMKYKVGYGSLDAVFLSHLHLDHFLGVYGLIETLHLTSPNPKPVLFFAPKQFEQLLINKYPFVRIEETKKGELFRAKGFSISAFPVKHSQNSYGFVFEEEEKIKFDEKKAKSLGLKGKMFSEIQTKGSLTINGKKIKLEDITWIKPGRKVVYTGDTAPISETVKAAKDADLLIHEATFSEEKKEEAKERFHSTAMQAAEIAKKANVKKLILTHISSRYSSQEELKKLLEEARSIFPNCEIAFDGQQISL